MSVQSMQALAVANQVREANARTKNAIGALSFADGCLHVAGLLADHPAGPLRSMKAIELLCAIRKISDQSAWPILHAASVYRPDRRLGQLTDRQRAEIASALRERVALYQAKRRTAA